MLLAVDTGNSDITIGAWDGNEWTQIWRVPSISSQPELFYGVKIREHFLESNIPESSIDKVVISSVVPSLTEKLRNVIIAITNCEPVVLGPPLYKKLKIEVLNPYEIGSDLVANAVAAYDHYQRASIVVDFGTALTFTTISDKGKILGVSIVPGLKTAIRSLTQNTAKLFDVPLQMPTSVLGTSTITAIQSGILVGYQGLVQTMIKSIRHEIGVDCPAIATGGLSSIITPLSDFFDKVDPHLTLSGLRIVGETTSN